MKNIFKKVLIIFIIFSIILSINIISRAENESTDVISITSEEQVDETNYNDYQVEDEIVEEESQYQGEEVNDSTDYVELQNFFSVTADDVTINNDVIGDVFICSGGTVTINSVVTGNVFVCAKNVTISDTASIYSSLFSVSENLNISGSISQNVYASSKVFTLNDTSYIELDLFLSSEKINFGGYLYRNANISGKEITFSDTAYIDGNLTYSAPSEVSISEDIVYGNIDYQGSNITENTGKTTTTFLGWLYSTVSYIVFAIILFLICKFLNCKIINDSGDFTQNMLKYLLYGILGLIATPIITILLFALNITAPIAFILLILYIILMFTASPALTVNIANLCAEKLEDKFTMNNTLRTILCIIAIGIIYKIIKLIPIASFIITLAFGILGFGLLIKSLFFTKD